MRSNGYKVNLIFYTKDFSEYMYQYEQWDYIGIHCYYIKYKIQSFFYTSESQGSIVGHVLTATGTTHSRAGSKGQ